MYEQKIEEINLRLKDMQNSLEDLKFVSLEAEQKPILPVLRPLDYFNIGDKVLFFVEKGNPDYVIKEGIFEGEVICDYKHHRAWVNFVANESFHTGGFKEGKGWRNVIESANILLKTDVEYLKNNKEYSKLWFGTALEEDYNPKFKKII